MHTNDSDYQQSVGGGGGGGGGAGSVVDCIIAANGSGQANHQAYRYRQSPSPARQRVLGGAHGGSSSQLSAYGRKRSNILPPYRTQQPALLQKAPAAATSMQNMTPLANLPPPPRRRSAAGITHNPSVASGYRSQSVDGLLDQAANGSQDSLNTTDQRIAAAAALVAAGSTALTNASSTCTLQPSEDGNELTASNDSCYVARREKSTQILAPPAVQQHRKSRSLDHMLSKQTLAALSSPPELGEESQSMQNLAMPSTLQPERRESPAKSSKSSTPERPASQSRGVGNRQSPDGVSSTESEREDTQVTKSLRGAATNQQRAAAHVHRGGSLNSNKTSNSSLGSNNSTSRGTILNRTMKKVRSLMKKP